MIRQLSILIPTYNDLCLNLVKELHAQAQTISGLDFEIIVADDGSTDTAVTDMNKKIADLPRCRYIMRPENSGRAAIRNFLVQQSRYDYLLFIDSGVEVKHKAFIKTYLETPQYDVIYGGVKTDDDSSKWASNLRFLYEKRFADTHKATLRQRNPYQSFRTTNFFITRKAITACAFNEHFTGYGYEDVLMGKLFEEHGYGILHMDNEVVYTNFETNEAFLTKTEEALFTLRRFDRDLCGYSKLLSTEARIKQLHLHKCVRTAFKQMRKPLTRNLLSRKPSLAAFQLYKLGFLCGLNGD